MLEQSLVSDFVVHGADVYVAESETLARIPVAGGQRTELVSGTYAYGIAIVGESAYFTGMRPDGGPDEQGKQPMISTLESVPLAGGAQSVVLATPPPMNEGAVTSDDASIYFADWFAKGAAKLTPPATALEALPLEPKAFGTKIAIASGSVFVAATDLSQAGATTGLIERIPKSGGAAHVIVSGIRVVGALAADESGVYFAESGDWQKSGRLARVNHDGSGLVTLVEGDAGWIALSSDRVYYAGSGGIQSLPKSGGSPIPVAAGKNPGMLRIEGKNLLWVDPAIKAMSDPTVPELKTTCIP